MIELNKLYFQDTWETIAGIDNGTINLLVQDTPFGVTKNKWDIKPDLAKMWPEWLRITTNNAAIIFFATQPFASELIMSMPKLFRYDLIWNKLGKATGFLNAARMPLRSHESILVFYRSLPTYNPQKEIGRHNHSRGGRHSRGAAQTNNNYGKFNNVPAGEPTKDKFPLSVLNFASVHPPIHPTQKPVDLLRYLILTYSNSGDIVYDGYIGSGTTAEACIIENRNFIGSENHEEIFKKASKRIGNCIKKTELFQ